MMRGVDVPRVGGRSLRKQGYRVGEHRVARLMRLNLPGGQATGIQGQHFVIKARQAPLPLVHQAAAQMSLVDLEGFPGATDPDWRAPFCRSSHCANCRNSRSRVHGGHSPNESSTWPEGLALPRVWLRLSIIHAPPKYPRETHIPVRVHPTRFRFWMDHWSSWAPL